MILPASGDAPAPLLADPLPEGQIRRIELRMEAIEAAQAAASNQKS